MPPLPPQIQHRLFTLSFGFAALVMATQNVFAQTAPQTAPQCAPRAAVLQALGEKYREARRGIGIAGQNMVMELFVNPETGSWTITATAPNGSMCLIASGSAFESVTDPAPAKGSPA